MEVENSERIEMNDRLLITFCLLAYNQERFIREAIDGALSQTYSPLEIILSDDCSSDRTYEIIQQCTAGYKGPHKIILNRNSHNLGIGGHVNRIMELANGELIVGAAGDDISLSKRVEKTYDAYVKSNYSAKSVFSNSIFIDESGMQKGLRCSSPWKGEDLLSEVIVKKDSILSGCSHAWSREVFDLYGPLKTPLTCEDMVIPFRSALLGRIDYIHEPLVMYRRHETNVWPYGHYQDVEKRINFEKKWVFERKNIYENWLNDLATTRYRYPCKQEALTKLEEIVRDRLSERESDIGFINSDWLNKCKIIARDVMRGGEFKTIRYRIGLFMIPSIYKCYSRMQKR